MKKINFIKLGLDLLMGIIFALLFNKNVFNGMTFHEVAGLAIGLAVIIHLVLNLKLIKNVTSAIFDKKTPIKTKIGYVINILLFLDIIYIIISGICISKVLFTNLNIHISILSKSTHSAAAYTALLLIGIHVGLHWSLVINTIKNIIKSNTQNKALSYASKIAAILVLAFGIYSMVTVNYFTKILVVSSFVSSSPSGNGPGGNGGPQGGNAPSGGQQQGGSAPSGDQQQGGNAPSGGQQQSGQQQGSSTSSDTQQNSSSTTSAQQLNSASGNNSQSTQNGNPSGGKGNGFPGGGKGMNGGRDSENANIFSILSIIGAFSVITYYIDKLPLIFKKKKADTQQ